MRINLNFLELASLLIDGNTDSNPGPTQNDCKSLCGRPKKLKCLKEHQNSVILVRKFILFFLVIQRYKIFFEYNSWYQLKHY